MLAPLQRTHEQVNPCLTGEEGNQYVQEGEYGSWADPLVVRSNSDLRQANLCSSWISFS